MAEKNLIGNVEDFHRVLSIFHPQLEEINLLHIGISEPLTRFFSHTT